MEILCIILAILIVLRTLAKHMCINMMKTNSESELNLNTRFKLWALAYLTMVGLIGVDITFICAYFIKENFL